MSAATQVTFTQYQQPGLKAGTYTVGISITALNIPPTPVISPQQKVLQVGGTPAFLAPRGVQSVFPPANSTGDYSDDLPHIVLNSATFPWQRFAVEGDDTTPWVALLLLTDDEYAAQNAETPSTETALNLDPSFFAAIAPSLADLAFLAHVRTVDTANKVDSSTQEADYAVVVCNRLPVGGENCRAFLVSLEDQGNLLPPATASGNVALQILYSWRFFANVASRNFIDVVSALDAAPLAMPAPALPASPSPADTAVANALSMGYTAVSHDLRVGGRTASWYRGPFAPYAVTRSLELPINSADAACFYDPTTGMMDASCSSAWALGQLLALNSPSFATGLYTWKRNTQRQTIDALEYELVTGQPAPTGTVSRMTQPEREARLAETLTNGLQKLGGWKGPASTATASSTAPPAKRGGLANPLREAMHDPKQVARIHAEQITRMNAPLDSPDHTGGAPNTESLWQWMSALALFNGVPFHYLVPDPAMLPPESIRFFQVDPLWLEALLEGAFSIGRSTEADRANDTAFSAAVRTRAFRHAITARNSRRGVVSTDSTAPASPSSRPASGFLMRSMAVTQWPGLEVVASGASGSASILRMDKTQTVMLCIFDQPITSVTLREPSEGLHFGFEQDESTNQDAPFKYPRLLQGQQAGTEITTTFVVPSFRGDSTVVKIADLATALQNSQGNSPSVTLTSAEFGLEMIVGVGQVTFSQ